MRTFSSKSSPFLQRYHFAAEEFEAIALQELRSVDLLPDAPKPIRVDRFIEKRFDIVPEYDDLPDSLVGFTRFDPNGPVEVVVARALADDGSPAAERRINSTLAHEAGHIVLHGQLFTSQLRDTTRSLSEVDVDADNRKVLCRDDTASERRYDGRWWEYQANQMIEALLLPRRLVLKALEPSDGPGAIGRRQSEMIPPRPWPDTFDVNPVVARIRIDQILRA